ncbi:copper homeostasis protein CutC [Sphingomonas sp. Leaf38]|uniref:copper homeostasis protein CutC n=1 Tax=Sphingomonas sp. Leaf38 TaxID=1736217 RepID=UPI0006F4EAB9|nr:copper homeostasis protein CutC [Sphingomonas sp. Leaf38]KQN28984.1 copper homeostasis protein CutC [Sphingomonas sp. Leaf38]
MTLEICVDDIAGIDSAVLGGADRLELCSALSLGGLTPTPALIAAARALPIPVHMLVRPREGGFRYTPREAAMIAAEIATAAEGGLAGVVIGASGADHTLDAALLARLVDHARACAAMRGAPLSLTLHRAFDLCPDLPDALETAVGLGFDRILTSGGAARAIDGLAMLATLHRAAAGRIVILPASGIDAGNASRFLDAGLRELHASCGATLASTDSATARSEAREREFGFAAADRRITSVDGVRNLKLVLDRFARQAA